MATLTNIQVDEIILHILDPPDPPPKPGELPKPARRGLVLSERPLPPTTDARVFGYFRDHIADSLKSDYVRLAKFKDPASPIAVACKAILAPKGDLVQGSQSLAQGLYALMAKNASIARGDLAVCRYSAQEDGKPVRQLALLKIDPSEAFSQTTKTDEQGKRYVAVEVEAEVLPAGELQKCALVRQLVPRRPADYDMILRDRQLEGENVARFFSLDFLGTDLVIDSRQATKGLRQILTDTENRLLATLQPDAMAAFHQQVRTLLALPIVSWNQVLQIVPPEARDEVSDSLKAAKLPDPIQLAGAYLAKVTKTVTYEGDYDLTLTVPANRFAELVTVIPPETTGPGLRLFEIVIRTQKWEKVD